MPYIPPNHRVLFDREIGELSSKLHTMPDEKLDGTVNYVISKLIIHAYGLRDAPNYYLLNRALGVLEGAKLETYRRIIGPYEDNAAQRNGEL